MIKAEDARKDTNFAKQEYSSIYEVLGIIDTKIREAARMGLGEVIIPVDDDLDEDIRDHYLKEGFAISAKVQSPMYGKKNCQEINFTTWYRRITW